MENKNNSKDLNKKEETKRPRKTVVLLILCCVILIGIAFWMFRDQEMSDTHKKENTTEPAMEHEAGEALANVTETTYKSYGVFQTSYCPLYISEEYIDSLRHVEVNEGDITMEVFYMRLDGAEKELFRIYFGNANLGDPVGILKLDAGQVPVTVTACAYSKEDFADEDTWLQYHALMEELNTVLGSIRSDSRYQANGSLENPVEKEVTEGLSYWDVPIHENMEWEEATDGVIYKADFYGTVAGERILFYSLYLDNTEAESIIGSYVVDGVARMVCVDSYGFTQREHWTDADLASAYSMMESINDVIQAITSSEHFSIETTE